MLRRADLPFLPSYLTLPPEFMFLTALAALYLLCWLSHCYGFKAFQAKQNQCRTQFTMLQLLAILTSFGIFWPTYPTYLPDLPIWPTFLAHLPDLPTWQKTFSLIQTLTRAVSQFLRCLKTELLKQFYDKLILPEMPGGIIDQKKFFRKINICAKKWLFFPKKAIFDH